MRSHAVQKSVAAADKDEKRMDNLPDVMEGELASEAV
jgi:hypothetical protein